MHDIHLMIDCRCPGVVCTITEKGKQVQRNLSRILGNSNVSCDLAT